MSYLRSFILLRIFLLTSFITRVAIGVYGIYEGQLQLQEILGAIVIGWLNDLLTLCFILPVLMLLRGSTNFLLQKLPWLQRGFNYFWILFTVSFFTSVMFAELVFWDEFGTKFNFIAVDYLIYTREIVGTIRESLPVVPIAIILSILNLTITYYVITRWYHAKVSTPSQVRIVLFLSATFIAGLTYQYYDPDQISFSNNRYAISLGKNGPREFVYAFYNNSLNYRQFYPVINEAKASEVVRSLLQTANSEFINSTGVARKITSSGIAKRHNVVIITVESLSAGYMGTFGHEGGLTPYLDDLAKESLLFTRLYAAGTRTVRGLEALSLSVPPTPGSSIIRRPNNAGLFTTGSVFREKGYDVNFIFGGYSYFDNLLNYFTGNSYRVTDRNNLSSDEITFGNIWGVADENILDKSLEIADESYANDKPFFSLIMTTSNHRPYTYPEGKIDIPSGTGRSGGVKYTDYAIGKFIEKAKTKQWFDNTIFVVIADHCAGSAGKTNLPIYRYHIPFMIYAPKLVEPGVESKIVSQIDVPPTILGLLNFDYQSKFYGQDVLHNSPNRALLGTYQLLGYLKGNILTILAPNKEPTAYEVVGEQQVPVQVDEQLVTEAVSYYQNAYDSFFGGGMKEFTE